jgi:tetratricopeptide (TPR) repeat protein
LGKSHAWHLARAEAFRQEQDFAHAEPEYRFALQETPNDLTTQIAYADTLFHMRRYQQALAALATAQNSPTDPRVYALRAQIHAKQGDRMQRCATFNWRSNTAKIKLTSDGHRRRAADAGRPRCRHAAIRPRPRYSERRPHRSTPLAIAQVFLRQGHYDDARRQIALGFAEARTSSSSGIARRYSEAASIFWRCMISILPKLISTRRSWWARIPRRRVGLANTYLAEGETNKAKRRWPEPGSGRTIIATITIT